MSAHIAFVETRVTADRYVLTPVEIDRLEIVNGLSGAMVDAEREVCATFLRRTAQMGYASVGAEKVDNAPKIDDDACDCGKCEECQAYRYKLDLLKTLKQKIKSAEYGILLDMTAFCFSLSQVCEQRAMKRGAVIRAYADALNEWCVLRGWGDQKRI